MVVSAILSEGLLTWLGEQLQGIHKTGIPVNPLAVAISFLETFKGGSERYNTCDRAFGMSALAVNCIATASCTRNVLGIFYSALIFGLCHATTYIKSF